MAKVLYIVYDGLMEPLGMSQSWQYLKVLSGNHDITIISFEKKDNLLNKYKLNALKKEVEECGVSWYSLKYHKTPSILATLYDVVRGILVTLFFVKKSKIDFIHSRSYIPTLIALIANKLLNTRFIFDMRGFWADEQVDGGVWAKNSFTYKIIKRFERSFFLDASYIISLTNIGCSDVLSLDYMKDIKKKITVIPTCANLQLFHPEHTTTSDYDEIDHKFILGYVGSVGTFYLFDEVLKSFNALLKVKNNSKLLIINKGQHDYIFDKILEAGISSDHIEIKSVEYDEVSAEMNKMDAGIFYIKPAFSKRSSSPTKFAEFLGCGKPCISNFGVGDTESILEGEGVGIVLKGFSNNEHISAINKLLKLVKDKNIQKRCTHTAKKYFSLDSGVKKYDSVYRDLTNDV
ncbi:glycosyltransferase [bacterium]|jgi:glycosyltransferase involved in cell wall biosynthesis|nr:glycosyltransferase [bacterium]